MTKDIYVLSFAYFTMESSSTEAYVFTSLGEAKQKLSLALADEMDYYNITEDNYDKDQRMYGSSSCEIKLTDMGFSIFAYGWDHIVEALIEQQTLSF